MNITFFIGNGFDLNIGLKTSYTDFLKWYTENGALFLMPGERFYEPQDQLVYCEKISNFKRNLRDNLENWSDLEISLGANSSNSKIFDSAETFMICKYDLDMNLQTYLFNQNDKVDVTNADVAKFAEGLKNFMKKTPLLHSEFGKIIENESSFRYNLVCFNYTNVLHRMYNQLHRRMVSLPNVTIPNNIGTDNILIHNAMGVFVCIHGSFNRHFIQGLDNIEQIANEEFRRNPFLLSCCLKSKMYEVDPSPSRQLESLIDATSIYCIYGMSIGESDLTWWKKIGQNLKKNTRKHLVIFDRSGTLRHEVPYFVHASIDKAKNRFCERAGISREDVEGRIHVVLDSDIFDIPELKARIEARYETDANERVSVPDFFKGYLLQ